MVQLNFNASSFQPRYGSDGGGLPPGKHKVIIEKSEIVPTKDNAATGNAYLKFTLKCIDGLANGGIQEDRLNLHNSNAQTVQIAQQQLAAYCAVVGKPGFNQTEELHNIPFFIEVRTQRNNPDFTEVSKLFDIQGNEPGKNAAAPAIGAQPQPAPAGFAPTNPAPGGWQQPQPQPEPQQQFQPAPQPQQQWGAQPAPQAPAAPWSPQGGQTAPGWQRQ